MGTPKIFPDSIIYHSTEKLIADSRKSSCVLYLSVLGCIVACLVSLFFIHIKVGVRATGIIKTQGERKVLSAPMAGKLAAVRLSENLTVNAGDTLFVVDAPSITLRIPALERRKSELSAMIADLQVLTCTDVENKPILLINPVYIMAYSLYWTQLNDYAYKERITQTNFTRAKALYEREAISLVDFELAQAEKDNAILASQAFRSSSTTQWQLDLSRYENELRDLEAQLAQIDVLNSESVVLAPVSGTIQSIGQVTNGMYVHSGQSIAEFSSDGVLLAECAVVPKDIGYLYRGQPVRIRVDAFDYNLWGVLEGEVLEIFDDIVAANGQQPYYRIYCSLHSNYLTLKNGRKDYLKKGMTLTAHFMVAERTAFQLLYDKADKWLNPEL
ncbi:MAG: HlyD family secretion protein [Prevotellaceae bacterium]|jgi:HlyD family secretion protein|nr:HlyD family secretion protein [Prevotellaceae bacterium]